MFPEQSEDEQRPVQVRDRPRGDLHGRVLRLPPLNIHLFTSHYHANYSPRDDVYLAHRIVHSVESAQWIKLSSASADLTIYAGDFNTEPSEVPYQIVRHVTPLEDAWVEANGAEGGETSETPGNSYTLRIYLS